MQIGIFIEPSASYMSEPKSFNLAIELDLLLQFENGNQSNVLLCLFIMVHDRPHYTLDKSEMFNVQIVKTTLI